MIVDAHSIPGRTVLEADVCIIGAGPAGITLAQDFNGKSLRVILLEAGSLNRSLASQAFYKGESVGIHYEDLDQSRARYFGGSSNCWGGFSRPLDTHDFEVRDWVPNSGWPIKRSDLLPYYQRAHGLLQLGPFEYDPPTWEDWIDRPDARLVHFHRPRATNIISQISPPTRFGEIYREAIDRSKNVFAYLNANVTEIDTPGNGSRVGSVRICTLGGGTFRVVARTYILATGGIETPRLLLASNRHQPAGVGNQHDLVGRYFMDHPRLRQGSIAFRDPKGKSAIYDMHITFPGEIVARGVKIGAFFGLTPETQRAERIGNTRCYTVSRYVGDDPASYTAMNHLRQAVHRQSPLLARSRPEIINAIRKFPNVVVLAAGLKFKIPCLARGYVLETVVEPTPLYDSRVTLGGDRDPLGIPRIRLDWRLGELEKRTIRRTQEILSEEIAAAREGEIVVDAPDEGEAWPATVQGCWHHMGTTRMHENPRKGVVDAQCRVHGMENLFIAGSSIFPTCGSDMPTITIVALALRLAEHIKATYAQTQARATAGIDERTILSAG